MSRDAITSIEERQQHVYDALKAYLNEARISNSFYAEMLEVNEALSQTLAAMLIQGHGFATTGIIPSVADLFTLDTKPNTTEAAFRHMKQQIEGPLGSKNTRIQQLAVTTAQELTKRYRFPSTLPIHDVYQTLSTKYIPTSKRKGVHLFLTHMKMVAHAIYEMVQHHIPYISDPPDDYFKPALHTLIVKGGDCDDVAILLCSLWRSIGFKTYLGFHPNHVYPGIILAKVSAKPLMKTQIPDILIDRLPQDEEIYEIEEVRVPADGQHFTITAGKARQSFTVFDLAFRDDTFYQKISALSQAIHRLPPQQREAAKHRLKQEIQAMVERFQQLRSATTYEVDPIDLDQLT